MIEVLLQQWLLWVLDAIAFMKVLNTAAAMEVLPTIVVMEGLSMT